MICATFTSSDHGKTPLKVIADNGSYWIGRKKLPIVRCHYFASILLLAIEPKYSDSLSRSRETEGYPTDRHCSKTLDDFDAVNA